MPRSVTSIFTSIPILQQEEGKERNFFVFLLSFTTYSATHSPLVTGGSLHTSLYTTEGGYSISQTKREKTGFPSAGKMYMGDSANYFWPIIDAFVSRPLLHIQCCQVPTLFSVWCTDAALALSMYPLMHSFP